MKKIALEEHFMYPGMADYWEATMQDVPPPVRAALTAKLSDFGAGRLGDMDAAGIDMALVSLAGPGVQRELDVATATRRARDANDYLAAQIGGRPDRYRGLAHLGVQDPAAAAKELERCVKTLGFAGAMINGHTNGHYLDDPFFSPVWEAAEALGAPLYLHPADPMLPLAAVEGHNALKRATWGWTVETGSHAMRIVFSGLFDRFPKAKLVLGHMGETLPYQLWRFDSRAKLYGCEMALEPSEYIRRNIAVTISGMYSAEPLNCAVAALGAQNVMFAADYPFEDMAFAARFMDTTPMDEATREAVAYRNAERIFNLAPR
ncbi:MAG: hypothetical protein JWN93_1022 [Hyphomicrobiales bacterium]|nr:hypothetical protein [Hyphomicrobiales bacterium]